MRLTIYFNTSVFTSGLFDNFRDRDNGLFISYTSYFFTFGIKDLFNLYLGFVYIYLDTICGLVVFYLDIHSNFVSSLLFLVLGTTRFILVLDLRLVNLLLHYLNVTRLLVSGNFSFVGDFLCKLRGRGLRGSGRRGRIGGHPGRVWVGLWRLGVSFHGRCQILGFDQLFGRRSGGSNASGTMGDNYL